MNLIAKLQKQPYETRVKILWTSVLVVGIILVTVFVLSIKNTISSIDGANIVQLDQRPQSQTAQTDIEFAAVERVESAKASLKVYFNFNNSTDDILNLSPLANITLSADQNQMQPVQITDRQGKPFVQKILSNTQVFGILVFPSLEADSAELTFDQMSFERTNSQFFQQKLKLNLQELSKPAKVRN